MGLPPGLPHPGPQPFLLPSDPVLPPSLAGTKSTRDPGLPSLPAAEGGGQDRASSWTPFLTLALCRGQTVLLGLAATHSWGLPHSNCNAWERACSVLFGWNTWFCKKLKKKKKSLETPLCMCVPGRAVPGPPGIQPPLFLAILGARPSPGRLRSDCSRCYDHSKLVLPSYYPIGTGGAGRG